MPITNAARDLIATAIATGTLSPAYSASNARIGVGDSAAAFAVGQTDLQGTSVRKGMDATFPTQAANVLTYQATFGPSEANFAWNEWGVFNAASGGTMLNRKVEALGSKTSVQTWVFTATITVTAA